jgi:hypothetical protein
MDYERIPLSQGKFAIVSPCDFEWLSEFKWHYSDGYARRNLPRNGLKIRQHETMHRAIYKLFDARPELIDHINCDKLDNRRENLRIADSIINGRNSPVQSNNRSGVTGVTWDVKARKWRAYIRVNRQLRYLGMYNEMEDAVLARKSAEENYFKETAYRPCQIS